MMFEVTNMSFALPEMFLLAMACTILLVVAFFKKTLYMYSVHYLCTEQV